jgi:ankyrin repeat protein
MDCKKHSHKTPLQLAAEDGNEDIVLLLMKYGARSNSNHPVDARRLTGDAAIALKLDAYINRRASGDTYDHSLFGKNPLAWEKDQKLTPARKILTNILEEAANPLANLSKDELSAATEAKSKLLAIIEPLVERHKVAHTGNSYIFAWLWRK